MSQGGCDLTNYGAFKKTVHDTDTALVANGTHLEFEIDETTRLVIFTGTAIVDFRPVDDNVMIRGTLSIILDYDLGDPSNLIDAAASAALGSVFNLDTSQPFTYAVDCVDVRSILIGQIVDGFEIFTASPMVVATVAIRGAGGHTGLSRVSYQANLYLRVRLQLLVGAFNAALPPDYHTFATLTSGQEWKFEVVLPQAAGSSGASVTLTSDNPSLAPVMSPFTIPPFDKVSPQSPPQNTKFFNSGPPVDVHITATFGSLIAHATLHINPALK